MAPRETENNAYAKFRGAKQRALWYVMVFSGVFNWGPIVYYVPVGGGEGIFRAVLCQQQNVTRVKLGPGTYQLFLLPGM